MTFLLYVKTIPEPFESPILKSHLMLVSYGPFPLRVSPMMLVNMILPDRLIEGLVISMVTLLVTLRFLATYSNDLQGTCSWKQLTVSTPSLPSILIWRHKTL